MSTAKKLEQAEDRIEELHAIIERKNSIIRLLALGDLSSEEVRLSDGARLDAPE